MLATSDYLVLVSITGLTFASSYYLLVDSRSLRQILMHRYFSEEIWKASESEENHEIREFSRDLAMSAASLGGISLAIVAFLMSGIFVNSASVTDSLSGSVGISFVLVSAMLETWAFSQFVIVSARSSSERTSVLARGVFRYAFYLQIYGLYFFLIGFVWALAAFNIYFSIVFVSAYWVLFLVSLLIVRRISRYPNTSKNSEHN
ncbi:MAG TPA: hypothetical protein VEC43_05000 [Candidatus Acidoferrales bacterium]|nr:hypothetical protein [Candidatus Acidoferrales bacterium]